MANRKSIVSMQQFSIEVLTNIVQKAGKASSADYCNLRATCKIMEEASNSHEVLHSLCLSPLVKSPLNGIQHMGFLTKFLNHENCAAYFMQGIITYFEEGDVENEMLYLSNAALGDGGDDILEAAYLYDVMRFLHGDLLEGPFDEIAFMYWQEDEEDLVARVWKNLRRILHGITIEKKPVYIQSMRSRRPPRSCHILDMEIDCPECLMYKRCTKFYYMNQSVPYLH